MLKARPGIEHRDIAVPAKRRCIRVLRRYPLRIGWQRRPGAAVAEHPEPILDVVGEGAECLHLLELGSRDDGERLLLPVDHAGLQRGIDLGEIDAGRRQAEGLGERG